MPKEDFPGESIPFRTFVAERSGEFNDSSIWKNRLLPYGSAMITISSKIIVTLTRETFDLNLTDCHVFGTLIFGSSSSQTFSLMFSSRIVIYNGGLVRLAMINGEFNLPRETILIIFPDGNFQRQNSTLKSDRTTTTLVSDEIKGPFTICSLTNGSILISNSIAFITKQSGEFSDENIWYGSTVPSSSTCSNDQNCSMNILNHQTISTTSLNGFMSIGFNRIFVEENSTFELNSPEFSTGFWFSFPVRLDIYGSIFHRLNSSGGISLKFGCRFYFYSGSKFFSSISNYLYVVNPTTDRVRNSFLLGKNFTGPFFFTISSDGIVTIDRINPRK